MEGEDSSNSGVKYLVGKTAGKSGVIAGLVATHIATIFGLWFYGARLPKFDFRSLNGYIYVGLPFGFTHPDVAFVVGGVFHYVDGILFGLIFALVVSPMMGRVIKPLAPMTPTTNYIKGLIWGWTLWIISSALWMPLLIGPILAPYGAPVGVFLTSFDGYGVQALLANLLWHTIWGANLRLIRTGQEVVEQQRSSPSGTQRANGPSRLVTSLEKRGGEVGGQCLSRLQRLVQSVHGVRDLAQCERLFADQHGRHAEIVASLRLPEPPDELVRDRTESGRDEQQIVARAMFRLD